jgi:hypothetical protein
MSSAVATWTVFAAVSEDWKRRRISGWSTSAALTSVPVPQTTKFAGTFTVTS